MALDDRGKRSGEDRFEEALAQHLRREGQADAGGKAPACPDAETLAAYHERSLGPEEMNSWKEHVAACARCEQILAALQETESIVVSREEEERVAEMVRPMATAREQASAERQEEARKRAAYWRWLAPAGAVAAGLLLWVALQEKTPPRQTVSQPVIVAENRNQAAAPTDGAAAPARGAEAKTNENAAPSGRAAAVDEYHAATKELPGAAPKLLQKKAEAKQAYALSAPVAAPPPATADKKDVEIAERTNALRDKAEPGAVQGALARRPQELEVMKAAPAPPEAAGASPATAVTGAFARVPARSAAQLAQVPQANRHIVPAPGGKVQWSVGPNGMILRSMDGGMTWKQQPSGVSVDLAAGSAPSETVCWVVGKNGVVLLTTDSEHWTSVSAPTTADLAGVAARDARHAEVWSDPGQARYVTQDAGRTWTRRRAE